MHKIECFKNLKLAENFVTDSCMSYNKHNITAIAIEKNYSSLSGKFKILILLTVLSFFLKMHISASFRGGWVLESVICITRLVCATFVAQSSNEGFFEVHDNLVGTEVVLDNGMLSN